jgi:hypothetical protein
MGRTSLLPLVFLLASAGLVAQQRVTADTSQSASLTHVRLVGANCPVGVEASRGAGGFVRMNTGPTFDGQSIERGGPRLEGKRFVPEVPPPAFYLQLHLTLTNPSSRDVVGARFTVHGFSKNWRVIRLSGASAAPDLAKTVEVALDVKGQGQSSSDLSLTHFTAITSIDLDSIAYADGSPWHASSPGACSIVPDMLMRIVATP